MAYEQLSEHERECLLELRAKGLGPTAIGRTLGRNKGTISRELKRNSRAGHYSSREAHERAQARRRDRPITRKMDRPEVLQAVREGLRQRWSPDQIVGRWRQDGEVAQRQLVSRQSIYRWLASDHSEAAILKKKLRHGPYRRRGRQLRRIPIANRVSIDLRPPEVADRQQVGHWEGDTVVGAKQSGYLVTLVERSSGLLMMVKTESKHAPVVKRAIIRRMSELPSDWRRSLTVDNGTEFAAHESITRKLDLPIYFAHPYSSYERGSNENCNGLIRQFFPKGTNFEDVSYAEVARIEGLVNTRPRKRLDYLTPFEFGRYSDVALEM